MSRPEDIPQDVWEEAKERLAVEYDFQGEYPSYAELSREGRGKFTHCSIRAVARAILKAKEDEREECAKILDHMADQTEGLLRSGARFAAGEIRLRYKQTQC